MEAEEAVDAGAAVGDVSDAGRMLDPLRVRRGVKMEKNFFTPCCPLDCADVEDEAEEELVGCVALAVMVAGEVGEVGVSDGGGASAAAVDAADLLEPDVKRLNITKTTHRKSVASRLLAYHLTTMNSTIDRWTKGSRGCTSLLERMMHGGRQSDARVTVTEGGHGRWTEKRITAGSVQVAHWQSTTVQCPPSWPPSLTSLFKMTSHPLPVARGPQRHYTEHSFDWQSLFDELNGPSPAPSLRAVADAHGIPASTLSYHYRNYRSCVQRSTSSTART